MHNDTIFRRADAFGNQRNSRMPGKDRTSRIASCKAAGPQLAIAIAAMLGAPVFVAKPVERTSPDSNGILFS
jgi:hypothetical protein